MNGDRLHRFRGPGGTTRTAAGFLVFVLLQLAHAPLAPAHLLQSEGDVGVLMHVDPGDEPAAGEQATLMFEMSTRQQPFTLDRCDCRLRITRDGAEVLNIRMPGGAGAAANMPFTFPEPGMYRAEVSGAPAINAGFRPFSIAFDIRVVPGEAHDSWLGTLQQFWYVPAGLSFLAACAFAAFRRKTRE